MIIIDMSQITIAAFSQMVNSKHFRDEPSKDMLRHMAITSILTNVKRVRNDEYGEIVLAIDSHSWRKQFFKFYKAARKKSKEESKIDWQLFFEWYGEILDDIRDHFPYKVVKVDQAEADDIIAVLTRKPGKHLIVSGDKDFRQLHRENVHQYSPVQKKWLRESDPNAYLFEHIVRGDTGDGIPNILSDEDTLVVDGKRQKPVTKKFLDGLTMMNIPDDLRSRFEQNKEMIDLNCIPENLVEKINEEYGSCVPAPRRKIRKFMIKHRMRELMNRLDEF